MNCRACCLLFLLYILSTTANLQLPYSHNITLNPSYSLFWNIGENKINVALTVQTTGWIGFGIGESGSGSMPGADFVVIEWDDNAKPIVTDRYASSYTEPSKDVCQDWVLKYYDIQDTTTTVELERALSTNDTRDRPITPGTTKVLWAYGLIEKKISYHNVHRGASDVTLIPLPPRVPTTDAEYSVTVNIPDYQIPPTKTNYVCYSAPIPLPASDKTYHITQIDPVIEPQNVDIVHHIVIFFCNDDANTGFYQNASVCSTGPGSRSCPSILFAWGVGGNSLVLPDDAGFPLGGSGTTNLHWVIIQFHYDNPLYSSDRRDSSGIRIHFTEKLRKYEADTLSVGNLDFKEATIPANTPNYHVEVSCPTACTEQWPHPITVFADFLHMHNAGSMIWTTLHRNETRLPGYFNRIEYWDFSFQGFTAMNKVIQPGDRLNLNCVYDTTGKGDTKFGEGSDQEMCIDFIAYYPKLKIPGVAPGMLTCGSLFNRQYRFPNGTTINAMVAGHRNYSTTCFRKLVFGKDNFTIVNPDVPDNNLEDRLRLFDLPNNACMVYDKDTENSSSEYNFYVHIILGIAAGFLVVGFLYALTQLNCHHKTSRQYKKVPISDELERY